MFCITLSTLVGGKRGKDQYILKNPFRPYFTCRRKDTCRYFRWGDKMSVDTYSARGPPVYEPREKAEMDMMQRPKLMRQFARIDKVTDSM